MFDKIRMLLKLDGKYYCENCGNVDYPVIVHGRKMCNHCSDAADPENYDRYSQITMINAGVQTHDAPQRDRMREAFCRLLEISYYGMYTPGNTNINDAEIHRIIGTLDNFFLKYQIKNNIQIAMDSINIMKTTNNIDTFFSRMGVCHNVLNGWWGEDVFFVEAERQKVRLLNDSFAKLAESVNAVKRESSKESRVVEYIKTLQQYGTRFAECREYVETLQRAKTMLKEETLRAVENNTYTDATKRKSNIVLEGYTDDETTFLDALMKSAGKYASYINLYREANGAITVQYYNESKGGPLTVGKVKLQGKTKNINIKNPSMGTDYDDVFKVDGELDTLLPHVGKFIEKIGNHIKALDQMEKDIEASVGPEVYQMMKGLRG